MIWAAAFLATAAPVCTASTAVRTTVEEMAAAPEVWFDRCVRLDGLVSWYYFYSGPKGRYRSLASDKEDHPNDGWLGLYFEDKRELRKEGGRASLFGIVDDCTRSYERATADADPGVLIMPIGYCHYQGGLILKRVRVISRSPQDPVRQTGEAARRMFGDLERPNEDHEIPNDVRALVRRFEQAFAAGDKEKLLALVNPYYTTLKTTSQKREYGAQLTGKHGPLRSFRKRGLPQAQWFYARPSEGRGHISDWFACYCRDGSCDERWPIAALDAVSSPRFPYACLHVFNYNNMGPKLSFDVVDEPYGSETDS